MKYQIAWADSGDGEHQMSWDETVKSLIAVVKSEQGVPQGGIAVIQGESGRVMLLQAMMKEENIDESS